MSSMSPYLLCSRCYSRSLYRANDASTSHRVNFSTTHSLSVNPPKKKAVSARPTTRQGTTLRLAKNKRASTARPPAVGERKALRKKIVLSNVNALEIQGLQDLDRNTTNSERLRNLQEQVLGFKEDTVNVLRALEGFKPTQGWSLFRKPAALVRKETVDLLVDLERISERSEEGTTVRKLLCGERESGKSVVQLQTLAMASLKKWIVVHIPEAKDLTNAQTAYQPLVGETGKTVYVQPTYTAKLLENIMNANREILANMRLSKKHDLPMPVQANMSLDRFIDLGVRDSELAYPIWRALWEELQTPTSKEGEGLQRPPVLFTLDGINHIMRFSAYLDADARPIHAHELALVRDFNTLLTGGAQQLPNGGMVLAATTESFRAVSPTLEYQIKLKLSKQGTGPEPTRDPYLPYDDKVETAVAPVEVVQLQGLSRGGAKSIMEYYARSGMLRSAVTNELVSEKWALSGGGIVGQIERASVRARF